MIPSRIACVVGARPNFMKVAPVFAALTRAGFATRLVHTGQHYDAKMSAVFFDDLGMPRPDAFLGVGSGDHAQQTAAILTGFDADVVAWRPDLVLVAGDVNSTIACALVAAKRNIAVGHIEAGRRLPSLPVLAQIAERLGVDVLDLVAPLVSPERAALVARQHHEPDGETA